MSNEITDNVFIAESKIMYIKQNITPLYNIASLKMRSRLLLIIIIANNYLRYIGKWFHLNYPLQESYSSLENSICRDKQQAKTFGQTHPLEIYKALRYLPTSQAAPYHPGLQLHVVCVSDRASHAPLLQFTPRHGSRRISYHVNH